MGRPGIRSLAAAVTFWWLAAPLPLDIAQNAGPQGQPVLRVTTRLVVLNVVVHDKKGAPVTRLTRADFTILDGGKKQEVAVFSVEASPGVHGHPEPLPADVFSNRVGEQGAIPTSVAVILLDGLDTQLEDQVYARGQMMKFLAQLQPQDRVALYVLGQRGLSVIQDFTSDPAPLIEAIRHYGGRMGPPPGSNADNQAPEVNLQGLLGPGALARTRLDAGLSSFHSLNLAHGPSPLYYRHFGNVLSAFEAIANRLSGLPGRRSLVWVTGGYPGGFTYLFTDNLLTLRTVVAPLSKELQSTAQALNRADVAIYPVDARGLFTDPAFSASAGQILVNPRHEAANTRQIPSTQLDAMKTTIMGLRYIAQRTGGRAFCNTNDLKGALRTALDDSEVTYTLGYYPTHGHWDGRYRPLKVRVDREGVEVRHRRGYFARPDQAIEEKDRMALLREAAQNPLNATGVGLTVKLDANKSAADGGLSADLNVDVRDLTFRRDKDLWTVSFDVWAGQYSNQGYSLRGTSKTVSANLKEDDFRKILRAGGLNLTIDEKAESGAAELRVVVRDAPSGTLGSVKIPLHQ